MVTQAEIEKYIWQRWAGLFSALADGAAPVKRRECSGPLPGGTDITVVQTGEKTLFVRPEQD